MMHEQLAAFGRVAIRRRGGRFVLLGAQECDDLPGGDIPEWKGRHARATNAILNILEQGFVSAAVAKATDGEVGTFFAGRVLAVAAAAISVDKQAALPDVLLRRIGVLDGHRLIAGCDGTLQNGDGNYQKSATCRRLE